MTKIQHVATRREFEEELARLGEELRQQIELECEGFAPDPAASKERAARAKNDYQFFCQTYFPHYVPTPHFSTFQKFVFNKLPAAIDAGEDARIILQAPRGEAKSTYVTQLGVLWCIVTGRKHMVAILMNTEEQATEMLAAIKAELDTNPRLGMDFEGAAGQGRVWQATTIVTVNNIKVRIGGTGKKIRGMRHGPYRPDLVVLDDLENDEEVRSKEQRDKTTNWALRAVTNLGPPGGGMDVFYVGTSLHYDAAINRVARKPGWRSHIFRAISSWPDNMRLWEAWEAIYTGGSSPGEKDAAEFEAAAFYANNKRAMDKGAAVSWPDVRPLYKLMCIRATDKDAFQTEYQNEPGNDENAPFKDVQFWIDNRKDWIFFGACDPSLGRRGAGRDPSAILVGGFNRATGVLDVVEADIGRRVPDLIIDRVIELQAQYGCLAWAVEAVQFQAFMVDELIKRSAKRLVPVPAVPVVPNTDKALRIMSVQPHVTNGLIRLHRSQTTLIEQLKFWPEAAHDDGPDALEMLWSIARQYGGEFLYESAAGGRKRYAEANDGWED